MDACLAQLVERKTFNLVAVGSSPTAGIVCQKGEKVSLYIVSGSVPEPGQRGATQDRMLYASWDRSPPLPFRLFSSVGRAHDF